MNKEKKIKSGVIAGNFDVIHPGYKDVQGM